jgi:methyl-accepting chemotaxis protein
MKSRSRPTVDQITTASREQSSGINQVSHAVNQMDQLTQQNAALVQESARGTQRLKDQAGRLLGVVKIFKVSSTWRMSSKLRLSAVRPRVRQ